MYNRNVLKYLNWGHKYVPYFWENSISSTEILPFENKDFLQSQIEKVVKHENSIKFKLGLQKPYERDSVPYLLTDLKIDHFDLEANMAYLDFPLMEEYSENGIIKRFGFDNFSFYVHYKDAFVETIWVKRGLIVSVTQFDIIATALSYIGETYNMLMFTWSDLELINLRDKKNITDDLMSSFK